MRTRFASRQLISDGFYWLVFYTVLWWLLAGGGAWVFGAVCVLAAAVTSLCLGAAPWRIRLAALPRFVGFFLSQVLAGGWDVARRAFDPRLPLSPAWVTFPLTCPDPRVRLVLSALVGLLPGTLSSRYEGDLLMVHTLDQHQNWSAIVAHLERALAQLLRAEH